MSVATRDFEVQVEARPGSAARVLLVDDDNNGPDVRSYYTAVLDSLGIAYEIWDTEGSDREPGADLLAEYESVLWFTGQAVSSATGPGSSAEFALEQYLNTGGCVVISSQDYVYNRGLTSFMGSYLGVAEAVEDVSHYSVSGQNVFRMIGPLGLSYPFLNFSDQLNAGAGMTGFSGDQGSAAVTRETGSYRSIFLGFPLEAVPAGVRRSDVLGTALRYCDLTCTAPFNVELASEQVAGLANHDACNVLFAHNGYEITNSGVVTLRARHSVVLGDGFVVRAGGLLTIVTGEP